MGQESESSTPRSTADSLPPPERIVSDIAEEIEDHLTCATDRHHREGLDAGTARQEAVKEFGDPRHVAAQLALISQGDLPMNAKVLFATFAVLAIAIVGTAFFSYRSTVAVADQMGTLGGQIADLIAKMPDQAAPQALAPFGNLIINTTKNGEAVPGVELLVTRRSAKELVFSKTYTTDATGQIDTGRLPLGMYSVALQWPFGDHDITWKREAWINQPNETLTLDYAFNASTSAPSVLRIARPEGISIAPEFFDRAEVAVTRERPGDTLQWKFSATPGQDIELPPFPQDEYNVSVSYRLTGGYRFKANSKKVRIPSGEAMVAIEPTMASPPFTGRIHYGDTERIVDARVFLGYSRSRNRPQTFIPVAARANTEGFFGVPDFVTRTSSQLRVAVSGPEGASFDMFTGVLKSDEPSLDIDLSGLAWLSVKAEGFESQPLPDLWLTDVVVTFVLLMPPDAPAWLPLSERVLTREVRLSPTADGVFEPARIILPPTDQAISASVTGSFKAFISNTTQAAYLSGPLETPPDLEAGAASDFTITNEQFMSVMRKAARDLSPNRVNRSAGYRVLRNWLLPPDQKPEVPNPDDPDKKTP